MTSAKSAGVASVRSKSLNKINKLFAPRRNVLLLGLPGGGKAHILYRLYTHDKLIDPLPVHPGVHVQRLSGGALLFTCPHVSDPKLTRSLVQQLCTDLCTVVYVVNAAGSEDHIRDSRIFLTDFVKGDALLRCKLVVVANKQDFPGAISGKQVERALELDKLPYQWRAPPTEILETSGQTGFGLDRLWRRIAPTLDTHRHTHSRMLGGDSAPTSPGGHADKDRHGRIQTPMLGEDGKPRGVKESKEVKADARHHRALSADGHRSRRSSSKEPQAKSQHANPPAHSWLKAPHLVKDAWKAVSSSQSRRSSK